MPAAAVLPAGKLGHAAFDVGPNDAFVGPPPVEPGASSLQSAAQELLGPFAPLNSTYLLGRLRIDKRDPPIILNAFGSEKYTLPRSPRIQRSMRQPSDDILPHSVYMTLRTRKSASQVVRLFTSHGWSWRNCAWDEYEIASEGIAELVITSTNPILVSGGVARTPNAMSQIEAILDNSNVDFEFDLFDEHDQIVRSRHAPACCLSCREQTF